jgi:hypothetical protein
MALADAGFKPEDEDGPPEQMMRTLRGFMDELAKMVDSPFDVIHSLQNAGAMLPAALRGFMATELALSPHVMLRDAVPLMLLDDDAAVRRGAAGALEQTAHPDTMSPDSLRRVITLRNWIPAADRPALDTAIRKARLAGVETGAWPAPVAGLEFHASTIDGSGAQSLLAVGCPGKGFSAACFCGWEPVWSTPGPITTCRAARSASCCGRRGWRHPPSRSTSRSST